VYLEETFRKSKELIKYLKKFCKNHEVEFHHAQIKPEFKNNISKCYICSREKRKRVFELAEKEGIKKIALGHHKEDVVESLLLGLFFCREVSAMKIKQDFFKGRLFIIRPIYFFTDEDIQEYIKKAKIKIVKTVCPYAKENKREILRRFIKELKKVDKTVLDNILFGIRNINEKYFPSNIIRCE